VTFCSQKIRFRGHLWCFWTYFCSKNSTILLRNLDVDTEWQALDLHTPRKCPHKAPFYRALMGNDGPPGGSCGHRPDSSESDSSLPYLGRRHAGRRSPIGLRQRVGHKKRGEEEGERRLSPVGVENLSVLTTQGGGHQISHLVVTNLIYPVHEEILLLESVEFILHLPHGARSETRPNGVCHRKGWRH
jgi:hypothetical protein